MNKNRITALVAIVALAGFIHTFVAPDYPATAVGNDISGQDLSAQKPLAETSLSAAAATTPAPTLTQPAEALLSQVKVYPTF
ncbi:MAG: hypothetical protein ACYC9J_12065 [Sulfuricaulis sp.]